MGGVLHKLNRRLFVPMAERLGLVSDIDRMLLTRALECLERHPERRLAVSLGSNSIASDSFRDDLLNMVTRAGRTAGRLWVGAASWFLS